MTMAGVRYDDVSFLYQVVLMATFIVTTLASESCFFPTYLQTRRHSQWMYKVRNTGQRTATISIYYVHVTHNVMSFQPRSGSLVEKKPNAFNLTCMGSKSDIYHVQHKGNKEETYYQCIQFVHRSDTVIQMKMSEKLESPDVSVCLQEILVLDKWPLILYASSNRMQNTEIQCPINGGYNLQIFNSAGKSLCNQKYATPRFESSCHGDRGLNIDFKNCMHESSVINMDRHQHLVCAASWSEGDHTITILRKPDIASFWCLSHVTNPGDDFEAHLFSDVVCDVTETMNYGILKLSRSIYSDICEDASADCEKSDIKTLCASRNMYGQIYCKKTCGLCPDMRGTTACQSRPDTIGTWEGIETGHNILTIYENNLHVTSRAKTDCLKEEDFDQYKRYALVAHDNSEGCYPRFICVSLEPHPPVLAYKLESGATWPQYEADYYCNARTSSSAMDTTESYWMLAQPAGGNIRGHSCQIPDNVYEIRSNYPDNSNCDGYIQTNTCQGESSKGLILEDTSCSGQRNPKHYSYTCIASYYQESWYEENTNWHIILVKDKTTLKYLCFVFSQNMTKGVMLSPSQCNEEFYDSLGLATLTLTPTKLSCEPEVVKAPSAGSGASGLKEIFHMIRFPPLCMCIVYILFNFYFMVGPEETM